VESNLRNDNYSIISAILRYQLLNYLLSDQRSECKLGKIEIVEGFGARMQITGPHSLFTIKWRNNTYDVTHFT